MAQGPVESKVLWLKKKWQHRPESAEASELGSRASSELLGSRSIAGPGGRLQHAARQPHLLKEEAKEKYEWSRG